MMKLLFVALVVLAVYAKDCPTAPAHFEDRRTDKSRMRISSFNAEWLFPGGDGKSPWTVPQADEHLVAVAGAVAAFNPDILSLQEVQSCEMLQRLIDTLQNKHGLTGWKPYMIQGTDTATGQNVGFITRIDPIGNVWRTENRVGYPIPGNKCGYSGSSGTYGCSKHYAAPFNINGVEVAMFGSHLLAYPTDSARCAQREAQASVVRGLIDDSIVDGFEIISFGDYNDYSDAVIDSSNDIPNSRVLRIYREGLIDTKLDNDTFVDPTLHEVSSWVPQNIRYTNAYDTNKLSMIDHILLSTRVANAVLNVTYDHSYPRQTVSDHWPIYVDIRTPFD